MSFKIEENVLYLDNFNEPLDKDICEKIEQVFIREGNESIPKSYFKKCKNLKTIVLPKSVTNIEDEAFMGCTGLQIINLDYVRTIGSRAFMSTGINKINLNSIQQIGSESFSMCQNLSQVKMGENIQIIPEKCFEANISLKEISLPSSVREIEDFVFEKSGLESVNLNKVSLIGIGAFKSCKYLREINLKNVKEIHNEAFKGCGLQQVDINVNEIPMECFAKCANLQTINLNNVKKIGAMAFEGSGIKELILPNTIKELGNEICRECRNLERVYLPNRDIPVGAFRGCPNLKEVNGKVENIGDLAFMNCMSLTNVNFPYLQNIGRQTFNDCRNLVEFDFSKINKIGFEAFMGCSSLCADNGVLDLRNLKRIEDEAFKNCINIKKVYLPIQNIAFGLFKGCKHLSKVYIPEGIRTISADAFAECEDLVEIKLPQSLIELGNSVFLGCKKLNKINLPEGIKEIPQYLFSHCESLEEIDFPPNLEKIQCGAFYESAIKNVNLPLSVNRIEFWAFYGCKNIKKVFVPQVEFLSDTAFSECIDLSEITIPATLGSIFYENNNKNFGKEFYKTPNLRVLHFYDNDNMYSFTLEKGEHFKNVFPVIVNKKQYLCTETNNKIMVKGNDLSFEIPLNRINKFTDSNLIIGNDNVGIIALYRPKMLKEFLKYEIYLQLHKISPHKDDVIISVALNENQFGRYVKYRDCWQKAEVKYKPKDFNDRLAYFKLCYVLGLFANDERHRINVLNFLNKDFIYDEYITNDNIGDKLDGIKLPNEPNLKLLNFFKNNYKEFEKDNNCAMLIYIINNFDEISKVMPQMTAEKVKTYLNASSYLNVNKGSENLARLSSLAGYNQGEFEHLQRLYEESQKQPSNVFDRIEDKKAEILKEETRVAKQLLDTVDDDFTFEWLNKHSEYNLLLGEICKCCARLGAPGVGIMQASALDPNVQNLAIREKGGDYIGKATIYVNPRRQYAVINNFIVKDKYRQGEKAQKVYNAIIRGINAFIEEYNKNNELPILDVTVGMANNKLETIIKQNLKKSPILYQGAKFQGYAGDSSREQYVVYSATQNKDLEK